MGKYEKKIDADKVPIISDLVDLALGESHTVDLKNKETGTEVRGYGNSINEAREDAYKKMRQEENTGLCFLTTACVEARGLPDNCLELHILRKFKGRFVL